MPRLGEPKAATIAALYPSRRALDAGMMLALVPQRDFVFDRRHQLNAHLEELMRPRPLAAQAPQRASKEMTEALGNATSLS